MPVNSTRRARRRLRRLVTLAVAFGVSLVALNVVVLPGYAIVGARIVPVARPPIWTFVFALTVPPLRL